MLTPAEVSFAIFAGCNVLRIAAYLPQMASLVRDPRAAASFSTATWVLFGAANASTALYAGMVLVDPVLSSLHVLSAGCCGLLIALARWRRARPVDGTGSALGKPCGA